MYVLQELCPGRLLIAMCPLFDELATCFLMRRRRLKQKKQL
jgi:hypothetical protein